MRSYHIAEQEISITDQIPRLEMYEFTGVELNSTPAPLSVAVKLISHSTGWVAGADRSVEVWIAGEGFLLRVSGFRDFYIAPRGKAILPVGGGTELTDLEQEVVLGPALALALALGGKWCLHASAASFDNKGMMFLGESGDGKSTLAAYLAEAGKPGWQRIADDILPVSLGERRLTGWTHFPQLKLPAENQPSVQLPETMLIDNIYLLDPDNSATTPQLKELSPDEMVRVLLGNTAGSRLFTPELLAAHLAFCAQAARYVTGYRLSFAHQRELLPVVKELLEQSLKQDKLQDIRKQL